MRKFLAVFLVLALLFTLAACQKDTKVKKDSNGNVIEQIYYRKDGSVDFTVTYTYYESGAVHTKKTVNEPSSYSNGFTTIWTWAEDGKSYQETTYGDDGMLSSDIFVELYDTTYENWRTRKTINYYEGQWSTTTFEEKLENGTTSVTDYTEDGKIINVSVYDSESNKLSKAYYNEEGVLTDIEEYHVDGYAKKQTNYIDAGWIYSEYFDENGKLLKYAFLANNGIFAEHTLSNPEYTLDIGFRGDLVDNVSHMDYCVIYERDENDVSRIETTYYYSTGTPAVVEKFDENCDHIYYMTYHENGKLLAQAGFSSPDVMTAYTVYDETGSQVFHYDCAGTEYTLQWQFYEDDTMHIYVVHDMQTIASYLFSGSQLIEETTENN